MFANIFFSFISFEKTWFLGCKETGKMPVLRCRFRMLKTPGKNLLSIQFRIGIDRRRIMPKECYQHLLEMDGWRGLPFDKNKLDDPNYIGLTVIERNNNSLFEQTCSLDRTEFNWSYRDEIKTLAEIFPL